MPGRKKQPIELILAKGNKSHLTKEEINERTSKVQIDLKDVKIPSYLKKQNLKSEFVTIANKLLQIGIMTELDEDCLASYIIAKDSYIKYTNKLSPAQKKKDYDLDDLVKLQNLQDKAYKQVMRSASELGLTITSRCKLIIPGGTPPKVNKFQKFRDDT